MNKTERESRSAPDEAGEPSSKEPRPRTRDHAARFGARVRELRAASGATLRGFALRADIDPSYLSKIERGEFAPPSEEKIVALALALGENPDALLAHAGRLPSDLPPIIFAQPERFSALLRTMSDFTPSELDEVHRFCREVRQAREGS